MGSKTHGNFRAVGKPLYIRHHAHPGPTSTLHTGEPDGSCSTCIGRHGCSAGNIGYRNPAHDTVYAQYLGPHVSRGATRAGRGNAKTIDGDLQGHTWCTVPRHAPPPRYPLGALQIQCRSHAPLMHPLCGAGDLDDWQDHDPSLVYKDVAFARADGVEVVFESSGAGKWYGEPDFSARWMLAWNDAWLYLALDVRDDKTFVGSAEQQERADACWSFTTGLQLGFEVGGQGRTCCTATLCTLLPLQAHSVGALC